METLATDSLVRPKRVKLQSQKCTAETHVWVKNLTQATASAKASCSEFIATTSWPPHGRTPAKPQQTSS